MPLRSQNKPERESNKRLTVPRGWLTWNEPILTPGCHAHPSVDPAKAPIIESHITGTPPLPSAHHLIPGTSALLLPPLSTVSSPHSPPSPLTPPCRLTAVRLALPATFQCCSSTRIQPSATVSAQSISIRVATCTCGGHGFRISSWILDSETQSQRRRSQSLLDLTMGPPFGRESWIWYLCAIGIIIARL